MTQTPISIDSLIETTPGFREGRPCLAGTGVTVHTVAALYNAGHEAHGILEQFPHLDLPRIHAALAYYLANKEQVDADIADDIRWAERMARRFPDGWRGETVDVE